MAISKPLKNLLDREKVRYTVMKHPVVYTAQEIASAQHIPGRNLAKSVLVTTKKGPVLAVLSASSLINFKQLKTALDSGAISLATERDIKRYFPDIEIGAMSPFGNLYEIPVVFDKALTESEQIVFNAGSHKETIKMQCSDALSLIHPKLKSFSQPIESKSTPKRKVKIVKQLKKTAKKKQRKTLVKSKLRATRKPKQKKGLIAKLKSLISI